VAICLKISQFIDGLSDRVGRLVSWVCFLMVLIGAFNAVARYLGRFIGFDLSSNAYIELQWYFFSAVFLLGAAYGLKHNAHVRVDVLYSRLSRKAKAWIDLMGTVLFMIPFCAFMIWVSWPAMLRSFYVPGHGWESSPDPGGLVRFPVKVMIPLAFALLLMQAVSLLIKKIAVLRGWDVEQEAQPVSEGL